MKILLFTEACAAGVGRHVMDLAEGLTAEGNECHVIYSCARMDDAFNSRISQFAKSHELPFRKHPHWSDLRLTKRLRNYAKKHGPFDILHGHSTKAGLLIRLAAFGLPGAVIYTPHAPLTMNRSLPLLARMALAFAELVLASLTWKIIAVSKEEGRHIQAWGVPKNKISVVPNGIAA